MAYYLIQDTTLAGIAEAIRTKTGGTDPIPVPDMEALISGISSGGLPAGIAEYEVQTFTPEADTNEALTFSLDMKEMPTNIMIAADFPSVVSRSFVACYCGFPQEDSGDGTIVMGGTIKYCAPYAIQYIWTDQNSTAKNRSGVWNLTNKGFTFRSNYYSGQFTYFRAGYTYTVMALRMVTL